MIDSFEGDHRFLSNFYGSTVEYEGVKYPTVEHAFQAAKTLDPAQRAEIAAARTPGVAKRMGRKVVLRDGWNAMRNDVMEALVRDKFTRHPLLRRQLLDTGDQDLIEGNWWGDTYWGVCRGVGENHLGQILVKIRKELRDGEA